VNGFVPILFRPTEGTISGDSALTWNPAEDALDINGTHITSNYIRSSGTNSLKLGTANAGQIVELTSTGNVGIGLGSATPPKLLSLNSGHPLFMYNSAEPANTSGYMFEVDSQSFNIKPRNDDASYISGAGTWTLDHTGNMGLGVTPESWQSGYTALQVGGRAFIAGHSGSDNYMGQNAYFNSGWKYIDTAAASYIQQSGGKIQHFVAPSGTANSTSITSGKGYTITATGGNFNTFGAANNNVGTSFTATSTGTSSGGTATQHISWTTAMTVTNTGNVEMGGNLDVTNNFTPASKINIGSGSYFIGNASQGYRFNNAADTLNLVTMYDGGDVRVHHGNLVIGTANKGIDFSAVSDGSRSVSANVLADYEEGTWTPTDNSGAGLTIANYYATYTKIGRGVLCEFDITYPANNNTSYARINMPYSAPHYASGVVGWSNNDSHLKIHVSSSAGIYFLDGGNPVRGNVHVTNAHLSNKRLIASCYFEAS
jgi:hypothetical protein